jgi:transcriptional regulator of acetoin/glycerol metabolism
MVEVSLPPLSKEGINTQAIQQILRKTDWNKAKAARLLGVDRKTLYRKIAKYRIFEGTSE